MHPPGNDFLPFQGIASVAVYYHYYHWCISSIAVTCLHVAAFCIAMFYCLKIIDNWENIEILYVIYHCNTVILLWFTAIVIVGFLVVFVTHKAVRPGA